MIFTCVWAFESQSDWEYIENLTKLFESKGAIVYFVELEADLDERLERNKTPNRLEHKPSKRDLDWSENDLKVSMEKHRMNSFEGEITHPHYIRINNTHLNAEEVAKLVKDKFDL